MALTLNTNLMALNASRNLSNHYTNLSTSVRRLSSGLRVGTAADDAAGLAIRELMRADIASLNQGVRNANDAISMIQTMEGALGVIDEKLIRMKELAEQAATGTYNSDQRLMIDSEFQAMKSEITRIATATDFNNVKLLCNDTANKLYIGDGAQVTTEPTMLAVGMSGADYDILQPEAVTKDAKVRYVSQYWKVTGYSGDSNILLWNTPGSLSSAEFNGFDTITATYSASSGTWSLSASTVANFAGAGFTATAHSSSSANNLSIGINAGMVNFSDGRFDALTQDTTVTFTRTRDLEYHFVSGKEAYPNLAFLGQQGAFWAFDLDGDSVADAYTRSGYGSFNLTGRKTASDMDDYVTKIHFGTGNDSAEDYYYIYGTDCTAEGLGIGGTRVQTQQRAQEALGEIDDAIIKKDKARAYFGAMQNRLENTISNLMIQAENTQAAESRISDVDVATEMTEFTRNQVLTSAAIAMLSQANSLPQMALSLMG